jgi:hypothetical protein
MQLDPGESATGTPADSIATASGLYAEIAFINGMAARLTAAGHPCGCFDDRFRKGLRQISRS